MDELYTRPKDMRSVDFCIWIDNNIYKENITPEELETAYQYLYHIAKMLAKTKNYFSREEYYEDFAIYFASSMYHRYTNKKQFEINLETGQTKLPKIKSVLNYMKNVCYARKVEFEQENYSQVLSSKLDNGENEIYTQFSFSDKINEYFDDIEPIEFDLCLGDICKTIKNYVYNYTPYIKNKIITQNIYISILLTFLNTITVSNNKKERINNMTRKLIDRPYYYYKLYNATPDQVILFHLDKNMRDYIWVLFVQIKRLIGKDLSLSLRTYIPANDNMNLLAMADINMDSLEFEE